MSKETNPRINVTLSLLYIAIILQFTMNSYDPLAAVPNKQQYAENAATVNAIKSYEGEVFVQNFGQLADMAGKHSTPHFGTVDDILVGDRGKVREDLVNNFKAAFSNKYYAAVFLEHVWLNYDYNNEIRLELERNYTETGTDPSHRFIIYEPKQR